jgi:protein phosphatase
MESSDSQDTAVFLPELDATANLPAGHASADIKVDLAASTHQGLVRANNEDHYLVLRVRRALHTLLTNLPAGSLQSEYDEIGYGMVVADGMGGSAGGEIASRLAITTLVSLAVNTPDWVMKLGGEDGEVVLRRMADRYRHVHEILRSEAQSNPSLTGMGTTMTLACSLGVAVILAHVGDSRAYLHRSGHLHQLTRDHTLAHALVERGMLRPDQALTHELRHVLTSALGGRSETAEVDVQQLTLSKGDQLLLCTDGLTEMVDSATVNAILQEPGTTQDACNNLIQGALQNGGKDNVTVILARYS